MINFTQIKQSVTTRQAAEAYGLSVNAQGMTYCPFHNDRKPSMKVDETFYCFGCGAVGDVITFTARYFGISPGSAARKLAVDFGIPLDAPADDRHSSLSGAEGISCVGSSRTGNPPRLQSAPV